MSKIDVYDNYYRKNSEQRKLGVGEGWEGMKNKLFTSIFPPLPVRFLVPRQFELCTKCRSLSHCKVFSKFPDIAIILVNNVGCNELTLNR